LKITESQLQAERHTARQSADKYQSKLSMSNAIVQDLQKQVSDLKAEKAVDTLKAYADTLRGYANADLHNMGGRLSPPPVGLDDIGFIEWFYKKRGSWT
jgi:hypothetical protein